MLLDNERYLERVSVLIRKSISLKIAVAFWGAECWLLFDSFGGQNLQIICNLSMGASNPVAIEKMMVMKNTEIRQMDQLHAKLLLSDSELILGSANMSTNGLGFEGAECANFSELGIYSTDNRLLKEANNWFQRNWQESRAINGEDIKLAKQKWKKRRTLRPSPSGDIAEKPSLLKINKMELEDRSIFFVIYRADATKDAVNYMKKIKKELSFDGDSLDIYEGWKEGDLPRGINDIIIPIRVPARRMVEIYEPQQPLPAFRKQGSKLWDLTAIMKKKDYNNILPFSFSKKDRQSLAMQIREWFDDSLKEEFKSKEDGITKPVSEFLQWYDSCNPS